MRAPHEGVDVLRAVAGQCRFRSQDVVSQCRSGEEQVFEIVVDAVGGRILVGVDLVEDHLAFAFQFPFGKGRTERHVGEQFDGLGEVAAQHGGVQRRVLLGGVGIQFAAEVFQPAVDLVGASPLGTLEEGVFGEVRQPVLRFQLVARAGAHDERAVGHVAAYLTVDAADTVGKRIGMEVLHGFYSLVRSFRNCPV